jgi:hypothetical protein
LTGQPVQDVNGSVAATKEEKDRPDTPAEAGHQIPVSSGTVQTPANDEDE